MTFVAHIEGHFQNHTSEEKFARDLAGFLAGVKELSHAQFDGTYATGDLREPGEWLPTPKKQQAADSKPEDKDDGDKAAGKDTPGSGSGARTAASSSSSGSGPAKAGPSSGTSSGSAGGKRP